ncbi:MAG: hypothetical protein AB1603_00680 [Chloroflexota bacterium]
MSYDWGPHYIVPSPTLTSLSGVVQLREELDRDLLRKELGALGLSTKVTRVSNPWYYRKKGTRSWVKIGESDDEQGNFPVTWDTSRLRNGKYEVLGLMHVYVGEGNSATAVVGQNVVEVAISN